MTISIFEYDKGVVVPLRVILVGTALNLGEKLKIYPQVLTFFIKPQIWLCHVVVLLTTATKWTKVKNARAGRAKLLFLSTKYANLRRSRCRRRCRCLSSLLKIDDGYDNAPKQQSLVKRRKTILLHLRRAFHCCALHNNNVKSPNLRF